MRCLSLVSLLIAGSSLVACSGLNGLDRLTAGEPKIDDSVWFRVDADGTGHHKTQSYDASLPNYIPRVCLPIPEKKGDITEADFSPSKPEIIIECTSQMKIVIDRRFDGWMDSLASWTNDSNAVADVVVVGAGLAGSLAGGATSRIMNAVTAGLTGTKKAINEDILLTKSVELIITQMKSNRAQWATIIANRLDATRITQVGNNIPSKSGDSSATTRKSSRTSETVKSKNVQSSTTTITSSTVKGNTASADSPAPMTTARGYRTLSEAWDDLQTYSRQGAFNEALTTIQTNVGAQSAACQAAKVNQKKGTTPQSSDNSAGSDSTTGSSPAPSTATSPCPPTAYTTSSSIASAPVAANGPAVGAATK